MKSPLSSTIGMLCIILIISAGCSVNSTNKDDTETLLSRCDETVRILGSVNEQSTIDGLPTAQELLDSAGDGFSSIVKWSDSDEFLVQIPRGGETELFVDIQWNGGEIREITSKFIQGQNEIAMICEPRLEVDVQISVSTEDGALNETWDAVLYYSNPLFETGDSPVQLTVDLDLNEINGTYQIVSIKGTEPDWVRGWFSISFNETPKGSFQIQFQQTHGTGSDSTVSMTSHIALDW